MTISRAPHKLIWPVAGSRLDLPQRRAGVFDYVMGIALYLGAFILRYALDDLLPPGFPYLTFFPAIVLATYTLGTGPGLLCAVLSGLSAWYAFLPPFYSLALTWQTGLALAFFIFIVAIDIFIIDRMVRATMALDQARAQAQAFAEQRDNLFSELQHRVGNNLMMVSAMLKVQARASTDQSVKRALDDAASRIAIVSDINRLFVSASQSVNLLDERFVLDLAQKCLQANGAEGRFSISASVETVELTQEKFLPAALTLAEAISNAVEHAFGSDGVGTIEIRGDRTDAGYRLQVADNGRGLPDGFQLTDSKSVGLKLLRSFAHQLGGVFTLTNRGGALSELVFPLPLPREREAIEGVK